MTPIHHPRMSHQHNDPEYKIFCHFAETLINIFNHPIKIKHLASWISHPKGETREEGGSTNHNQGEEVGAVVPLQNTVFPRTVLISKSCPQSGYTSTVVWFHLSANDTVQMVKMIVFSPFRLSKSGFWRPS